MNDRIANDLIRYAELVEDGALISPEEMNCASLMRIAAEALMSVLDGAQPAVAEQHKQELCEYCKRGLKTMCLCGIATKVIHQFRSPPCADWYDGVPDHHDGHGPYEVRTLYTTPPYVPTERQRKPHPDCDSGCMYVCTEGGQRLPKCEQRKPLTDEQIVPMFSERQKQQTEGEKDAWYFYAWGVSDGEAVHGIKE